MVDYGEVDCMAKALTQLIADPQIRERLSSAVAKRSKVGDPWNNMHARP